MPVESYDWKYIGKIAASIALSVILGLFWISNQEKNLKINKTPVEYNLGSIFESELGKGRTLVAVWASWCATCKEDLLAMDKLKKSELPKGFNIIALNIDEPKNMDQAKFLWDQLEIKNIKLLFDQSGEYQNTLSVDLLPSYFLFESSGRTLLRLEGQVNWEDEKLRSLLFD